MRRRVSQWSLTISLFTAVVSACSADHISSEPLAAVEPLPSDMPRASQAGTQGGNEPQGPDIARCEAARLQADRKFQVIVAHFRMTSDMVSPDGRKAQFVSAGDTTSRGQPTAVVVCEYPDTPGARARLNAIWAKYAPRLNQATSSLSAAALATGASAGTSDLVVFHPLGSPAALVECPDTTSCACPPEAIDCINGDVWDGPRPTESAVEAQIDVEDTTSASGTAVVAPITCFARTDYPHHSYTVPGMVNVHGTTTCPVPLNISVEVYLYHRECIWFYCWWSGEGTPGFDSGMKTMVKSNAAAPCKKGWWKGHSHHSAMNYIGYIRQVATENVNPYALVCY